MGFAICGGGIKMVIATLILKESTGYTVVEVPDIPGLFTYPGENLGAINGCRGKQGYDKSFWFFGTDNPFHPTEMYLINLLWIGGTTFNINYKQLPLLSTGEGDQVVTPNQVTVDKNGNIYFPTGTTSSNKYYYIAKITAAEWATDDPLTDTIYYNYAGVEGSTYTGTYCVALSKDHSRVMSWVSGEAPTLDSIVTIRTSDMVFIDDQAMADSGITTPLNAETDVSGGDNDGYSVFAAILDGINDYIVAWNQMSPATAPVTTVTDLVAKLSTAIDTTGKLYLGVQNKYCNGSPNLTVTFTPKVDHTYENETNVNMTCSVSEPSGGNTTTMDTPTHVDIDRTDNSLWVSAGLNQINGDVREITPADQNCRAIRPFYMYPCVATQREDYS